MGTLNPTYSLTRCRWLQEHNHEACQPLLRSVRDMLLSVMKAVVSQMMPNDWLQVTTDSMLLLLL